LEVPTEAVAATTIEVILGVTMEDFVGSEDEVATTITISEVTIEEGPEVATTLVILRPFLIYVHLISISRLV